MTDLTKRKPIRSNAILRAAKGEACACCGVNDETTVFAHINAQWAGKGLGIKADDFGMFLCRLCHDQYDGRDKHPLEDWEILKAVYRTWVRLIDKGIITVKDMK